MPAELTNYTSSGEPSEDGRIAAVGRPESPSAFGSAHTSQRDTLLERLNQVQDANLQSLIPIVTRQQAEKITSICETGISELDEWQNGQEARDETVDGFIRSLKCQSEQVEELRASIKNKERWTARGFATMKRDLQTASEQCIEYVIQGRAHMEGCDQSQDAEALTSEQPRVSRDEQY